MIASVIRLRVRSAFYIIAFLWINLRSKRQVVRTSGFRGGKLLIDAKRTYWTLTVWEDERAMKSFRGSGAHAAVMPKLVEWCDEASYAHWSSANEGLPDLPEAYQGLVKGGRLAHVAHPSVDH